MPKVSFPASSPAQRAACLAGMTGWNPDDCRG